MPMVYPAIPYLLSLGLEECAQISDIDHLSLPDYQQLELYFNIVRMINKNLALRFTGVQILQENSFPFIAGDSSPKSYSYLLNNPL
jgi:hypothetical protein